MTAPARKIVAFDAWTKGSSHLIRLLGACQRAGIQLTLVHVGSFGDEKGRARAETISGLETRDISHYPGSSLSAALDAERPDLVLFLSTTAFTHRAFMRLARARGIPTMHLFHGIQLVWNDSRGALSPAKIAARVWALRRFVVRQIRHGWPTYAKALRESGASKADWQRFADDVFGRLRGVVPKQAASDSTADRACVYTEADAEFATERYGYSTDRIVPVGNPDFITFGITAEMIGARIEAPASDTVMYIETAWTEYGRFSEADFLKHVLDTHRSLTRQGRRLIFKPHPIRDGSTFLARLREAGIEICSKAEFAPALLRSGACIVEASSAAVVPAVLGLPLLLGDYGPLDGNDFGRLLREYPRSIVLSNIDEVDRLLREESARHVPAHTRAWIAAHTGPIPADAMPDRVVAVAQRLMNGRHP